MNNTPMVILSMTDNGYNKCRCGCRHLKAIETFESAFFICYCEGKNCKQLTYWYSSDITYSNQNQTYQAFTK